MIKIFSPEQVRRADAYTIQHEPIASADLMERAASACVAWMEKFENLHTKNVFIFCGPGNNGGDGLAMARLLKLNQIAVTVFIPDESIKKSADFAINLRRAIESQVEIKPYTAFDPETVNPEALLVDSLFGSGLSKSIEGDFKELVIKINQSKGIIIAIDIPSGLFAGIPANLSKDTIVKADYTLSFQFPKLAFMFPENEFIVGQWQILPIGLHPGFTGSEPCNNFLVAYDDVKGMLKHRPGFAHKGNFGHALLIGGSHGKNGAAVLMAKACLHSGAGLVTVHLPNEGYPIMQTAVPEVMVSVDPEPDHCTLLPKLEAFSALAAGPGLGTSNDTSNMLKHLIQLADKPLVLDADALNILAENPTWLAFLPKGTVLTPHPGEFVRLAGKTSDSFGRLEILRAMCIKFGLNIVLKGAYTVTCSPLGNCYFNPTGNPGMATGGSGDALTGLIAGLLAQGYNQTEACILGAYLHGSAGDLALEETGYEALTAGKLIDKLGNAFKLLY